MEQRLPAGPWHGAATITLVLWGAVELALRLRLAARPGWRSRVRSWSALAGGRLREWTFFLVMLGIAGAVLGALWLTRFAQFAVHGGKAVVALGEIVATCGIALRIWAILTLDRFFTFVVGISSDHRVVQRGPYRALRHPGYAGALLALAGAGIAMGNWLSLVVMIVGPVLALSVRISVEETTLATALGAEYLAYASRTARLIPRVW
ncbi:MAG TPA: isoprenylcysteine carboxylmethyltransferase family protein [Streptosporangiaceae bacterium]|jgi:protein-S-isoprenylcysteine O-methyltransferase Ste14|nr:isoprenylcysteine carboxylmethyltransferase family protein [Streptosporangiaceae bacterium]